MMKWHELKLIKKFSKPYRVYLVPNRKGFTFSLTILFVLAIGLTYANNLILLAAFFLASVTILAMTMTHLNLAKMKGLKLSSIRGFENQTATP